MEPMQRTGLDHEISDVAAVAIASLRLGLYSFGFQEISPGEQLL